MSYFDRIDQAKVSKGSKFLEAGGKYSGTLQRCSVVDGRKGLNFFANFEITESSRPDCPPGEYSWCQKMTDKDIAFPALLKFLAACFGKNLDDPTEEAEFDEKIKPHANKLLTQASGPENIFGGKKFVIETWNKPTKGGTDFTMHSFRLVK